MNLFILSYIIYSRKTKKGNDGMMKNVKVEYHESGLIIGQKDIKDYLIVPNVLKVNLYEHMITACLTGDHVSWSDMNANRIIMNYEYKNHFNCFINGLYVGELPFIRLSESSIALPLDTNDEEQLYEIYDSELVETYLLYQSELF